MGIIHPDFHDAFLSYAHDDEDQYLQFVSRFRAQLKTQFAAKSRVPLHAKGREADVFIDHHGLPQGGDLSDEIRKAVNSSVFLFVFIGQNYPVSDWCLKEINVFLDKFKGKSESALTRVFLIVLSRDAAEKLERAAQQKTRPDLFVKAIRSNFYDKEGKVCYPNKYEDSPCFFDLLDKVTDTMIKRVQTEGPVGPPPPPVPTAAITIGVVTADLEPVRDKLVEQLRNLGVGVNVLSPADLFVKDEKELLAGLADCRLFVQPYSYHRMRPSPSREAGGHLGAQQRLLGELKSAPKMWWWRPAEEEDVVQPYGGGKIETDESLLAFLRKLDDVSKHVACTELSEQVRQWFSQVKTATTAQVLIEGGETEQSMIWTQLKSIIEVRWQERYKDSGVHLNCYALPFAILADPHGDSVLSECHGLFLLYGGEKAFPSLWVQVQLFDGHLRKVLSKPEQVTEFSVPPIKTRDLSFPERVVAVLPPREEKGDVFWQTLRLRRGPRGLQLEEADERVLDEILSRIFTRVSPSQSEATHQ